ncbi:MAG TPA: flagellar hook-associated protein 3 [Actinotalea sp.]|nr:flagellar hook-associated protein 3 [Actinotalea sp.]
MIGRVTQQTLQRSTLANLQVNLTRMSELQGRMSGGKIISKPSDDPSGTSQAMVLRAESRATQQYQRNATDGVGWLTTVDTTMQTSVTSLRNARNLTVQAGNGGLNQAGREAIALELESVRDSLLADANTQYLGRSVFAGTSDAAVAFTDAASATPYSWTGSPGASVQRRIAPDTSVRADADGQAVYGTGATSVFALLDTIAAEVRSGTDVSPRLAELDARLSSMLGELGGVGTRYKQLEAAQAATARSVQDINARLSGIEDIDLAQTIVELQMQEVAYQGALGATARVLQPTLMDFLR